MSGQKQQAILNRKLKAKDVAFFYAHVSKKSNGCWEWTAGRDKDGYGVITIGIVRHGGITCKAHRFAWSLSHDFSLPALFVLHKCDNPPCVNPEHLFLGTAKDNADDRGKKGRTAVGDQSGARLHPERLARGDRHGFKKHPEAWTRGDDHWTRKYPERVLRGDQSARRKHPESYAHLVGDNHPSRKYKESRPRGDLHWTHLHPERILRGDATSARRFPESVRRGSAHPNSKLTESAVLEIRKKFALGGVYKKDLAEQYGVSAVLIRLIVERKAWRHVL